MKEVINHLCQAPPQGWIISDHFQSFSAGESDGLACVKCPHRTPWLVVPLNRSQWRKDPVLQQNWIAPTRSREKWMLGSKIYHVWRRPEGRNPSVMLDRWWAEIWQDKDLYIRRMLGRKVGEQVWDYILRVLGSLGTILVEVEGHILFLQQDIINK